MPVQSPLPHSTLHETPLLEPGERLILVSNRLPVTLERREGNLHVQVSTGGLATGLSRPHKESGGLWIGWPGTPSPGGRLDPEIASALEDKGMIGVPLTPEEHRNYYTISSNRCIWPLFHYFTDQVSFSRKAWHAYETVNRKFANIVLRHARKDDMVFVQDFHLMLVPGMLREARPDLHIGFFLHIPFPSSEIYRLFPPRARVLHGLLGADTIGFHTLDYVRHFRSALLRVLGLESQQTTVTHQGRRVRLLAEPLGIDPMGWEERSGLEGVEKEARQLLDIAAGRKVILGVDRLDYTKGIPERLLAFREFLAEDPSRAENVMMIQVAVPSRVEVEEYRHLKDEVDRIAGQINGEFGRPGRLPLHYLFRSVSSDTLTALYKVADVALVTPLRDGLNLVAKEYTFCRERDDGVLVLGEFTGAAWELGEALRVNPYDRTDISNALKRALAMSPEEQARRMGPMRERVRRTTVHVWARTCISSIREGGHRPPPRPLAGSELEQWTFRWKTAPHRTVFLDYDGTLREFVESFEQAGPTSLILQLLGSLAQDPGVTLWIISGRPSGVLEEWLGVTGAGLVAEHGAMVRPAGESRFHSLLKADVREWRPMVLDAMRRFTDRVPGSRIEEKPNGLAWHYRGADPTLSVWQARELFLHLTETLSGTPLEVMRGNLVLEVRPAGMDKGVAVRTLLENRAPEDFTMMAGDDVTDEDVFRILPSSALTLLVGNRPSEARYRLEDPARLRELLGRWQKLLPRHTEAPRT
ncbi:MAG: bifunctional alpha,alpha-trehalose-phosphate synthase (UDP-forming)/trehalose-phosphatase [Planctomycetota bacterium]